MTTMITLIILALLLALVWQALFWMPAPSADGPWQAEVFAILFLGHTRTRWSDRYRHQWQAVRAAKAYARRLDYLGWPMPVHWEFGIGWGVRELPKDSP